MSVGGFNRDSNGNRAADQMSGTKASIENQLGRNGAAFTQQVHDEYIRYALTIGATLKAAEYLAFDLGQKVYGRIWPDYVYKLDARAAADVGTFTDMGATNLAGTAFQVFPTVEAQYDAIYIGFKDPFTGLVLDVDTAGVDAGTLATAWYYPSAVSSAGAITWTALGSASAYTIEDNTDTAPATGGKAFIAVAATGVTVQWVLPHVDMSNVETATSWKPCKINGTEAYWVKLMIGTLGYNTEPEVANVYLVKPLPALNVDFTPTANGTLYLNGERTATVDAIPSTTTGIAVTDFDVHQIYWTSGNAVDTANVIATTRRGAK